MLAKPLPWPHSEQNPSSPCSQDEYGRVVDADPGLRQRGLGRVGVGSRGFSPSRSWTWLPGSGQGLWSRVSLIHFQCPEPVCLAKFLL